MVVSVVPRILKAMKRILNEHCDRGMLKVVGENVKVPLRCIYDKRQIGQDRLVTAFAAGILYGLPILVIDFGTAITFDTVSRSGVYLGGLIVPGIKMSLESLAERTALLPKTYLKKPRTFLGKNTASSIRSGMIYGYSSLCDGMIRLFRKMIIRNIGVVATGGDAELIRRYTPSIKKVDNDLSLKGLYLLAEYSTKN